MAYSWINTLDLPKRLDGDENVVGVPLFYKKTKAYKDVSKRNILALGDSMGKTECLAMPYADSIINGGESLIVIESKHEIGHTLKDSVPSFYDVISIDLADPENSKNRYEPLMIINNLLDSITVRDRDLGHELQNDLIHLISSDEEVEELITLMILCLRVLEERVTLYRVFKMIRDMDECYQMKTLMKHMHGFFQGDSEVKIRLNIFMNKDESDQRKIQERALRCLRKIFRNESLEYVLQLDDTYIDELDDDFRPYAIFITLPEKTHDLAADMVVDSIMRYAFYTRRNKSLSAKHGLHVIVDGEAAICSMRHLVSYVSSAEAMGMRFMFICKNLWELESNEFFMSQFQILAFFNSCSWKLNRMIERKIFEQTPDLSFGHALLMLENMMFLSEMPSYFDSHPEPETYVPSFDVAIYEEDDFSLLRCIQNVVLNQTESKRKRMLIMVCDIHQGYEAVAKALSSISGVPWLTYLQEMESEHKTTQYVTSSPELLHELQEIVEAQGADLEVVLEDFD